LVGSPLDFIWPRKLSGFGGPVPVTKERIPQEAGSDPVRIVEGRFWLVNLQPGVTPNGEETAGGLLAMWQRAELVGGSCEVRSAPGAGTTVLVKVPTATEAE